MSCCVRRRCDGMGPEAVGCWSWELEGREVCMYVCLMEAVELRKDEGSRPVSWARAGGGGGDAPAFAAALPVTVART